MTRLKDAPPNYWYFRRGTNVLESRMKYQKHRLKKFESFDENKTEWDIMLDEGFDRVWDCGNAVYVLE
jgi:hypothetical protein